MDPGRGEHRQVDYRLLNELTRDRLGGYSAVLSQLIPPIRPITATVP